MNVIFLNKVLVSFKAVLHMKIYLFFLYSIDMNIRSQGLYFDVWLIAWHYIWPHVRLPSLPKLVKDLIVTEENKLAGKILVHCFMGISRSSTIACAYLMLKKKMSAVEAIQTLRQNRAIYPNDGFLQQLADLDNKLKKEHSQL